MKKIVYCLALAVGLTLQAAAESNTTNILDGVTTNAAGPFTLGDTGAFNFLLITNGGALTNTIGTVGNTFGANANLALVLGTNSVWHNSSNFILGATGSQNQVSILDGARLNVDRQMFLGLDQLSANNLLVVSGPGAFLDLSWFHLGQAGSGNNIVVTRGAQVGRGISHDIQNNIGEEENSVDNLLFVAGPGTSWQTDGFRVGHYGSRNHAIASDGAMLTIGFLTVGREISAMANEVAVSGNGTVWKVADSPVYAGLLGSSNQIQVSDGARFETSQATIGLSNTATLNVAGLRDTGTIWANTGSLTVGDAGPINFLTVANGALLRSGSISIGNNSANNRAFVNDAFVINTADLWIGTGSNAFGNLLSLQGPGTIWTNMSQVTLGRDGSNNKLSISAGAVLRPMYVFTTGFSIGTGANSRGNDLTVTGPGSALLGNWALTLGSSGSANRLLVADGAHLQSSSADIGQNCIARDNVAFIAGAGTVWSNGQLQVGFCSTNNQLVVSNGARVFAGLVRSSVQGGASNTFTVTGSGSLLRATGDLIVGNSGTANSLLIADGGRVEGRNDRVGLGAGNNAASLFNAGTSWSNVSLTIGDATPGQHLTVAGGARIDSGSAILGAGAKSSGNEAALAGSDTIWNVATNLMLGGLGYSNRLSLAEGASVSARNIYLGGGSLLNPTALFNSDWNHLGLQGTNSALSVASNLVVGAVGRWNRIEVRDAAQIADRDAVLGFSYGSRSNSVLVTGSGSRWHNAGNLFVGSNGMRSELIVSQGGRVTDHAAYIGYDGVLLGEGTSCVTREGGNRVLVTDPGSLWETAGQLYVGYGSIGNTLVVSNSGTVCAASLIVGNTNGITPGSSCGSFASPNRVTVDGGCVSVSNATADAVLEIRYGSFTLQSGVLTADRLIATNMSAGSLLLYGGTLRIRDGDLNSPGGFTGLPTVGGELSSATVVLEDGTLTAQPGFRMDAHSVIAGNGVVNSPLKNVYGGTIAPGGRGPGRLSLVGGLFGMDGGSFSIDIGGTEPGVQYDQVELDAALFAGRLDVRLRGGFVPRPEDTFEVIQCGFNDPDSLLYNVSPSGRLLTTDRLGSFQVRFSGTNVVLTDYHSTDLDGDGIEDAWATNAFGHTPLTPAEKFADADGDGASNYDEFKAGTDPLDPASVFRVIFAASTPRTLYFACVPGREYRVWYSDNLATWQEVPNPTFFFEPPDVCYWTDNGKDTGGFGAASRFYRMTVE